MQGPVTVGRVAETAAVRAAYERALAGRPGVVLISGEAGIGKSRLVSSVVRTLPDDPLVLSGGCLELGSEGAPYVPFVAVLRELIRGLGRDRVTALLPREGTALADWLPGLGRAPARYGRTRLLEEMLALLTQVADLAPVVLTVEDLHWADASSRELFAYLARNLTGSAVLLVGTLRTGELAPGHPNRRLLAELGRGAEVTRIELGPLVRDEVAALLAALDGRPPDPARAGRIHRRSGGNPLFVEALGNAGETPSDDLRTLLLDRITSLPGPAREVLSTLAVAGAVLAEEMIEEVGAVAVDRLRSAVADLVGRDLVVAVPDGYAIRHDLIREVVYTSVPPTLRRRVHARYAGALADRTPGGVADNVAMAEHWIAAQEVARALPAAWRAAGLAGRQNAYDEQLHLLELVLARWSEVTDPAEILGVDRVTVLEQAAESALAAGRSGTGITHATAALGGSGAVVDGVPGLGEAGPVAGRSGTGVAHRTGAPAEIDATADPHRVARLLGLRGQLRCRVDGTGRDDLEHALTLVPPGSSDALRGSLLSALGFICVGECRYDDSRRYADEALEIAERLDDDGQRARALLVTAALDGVTGELERAGATFATARELAEEVGDEHTFLTTFQWEAGLIEAAGRYERAAALAREGQLAAERLGRSRSRGTMLAVARAIPLRFLGRWDEAIGVVEDALAERPPPLYGAFLRLVAADIARCRGETERFEVMLRGLTEFALHARGAAEAIVEIVIQRIAWALDTGALDQADRLLGDHLGSPWPARETMRLALLGARVQGARRAAAPRNRRIAAETAARLTELSQVTDMAPAGSPGLHAYRLTFQALTTSGSLSTWDEAIAAWRDLGDRYQTAVALVDAATAALASNNRPGAASRLREARTLATELGAAPLRARIDDLTARSRLTDPSPSARNEFGLTRRELDVLGIVARGRSNRQIAEELFISSNTVATHVARILAKLQAATRTEAVGRARETGLLDLAEGAPRQDQGAPRMI